MDPIPDVGFKVEPAQLALAASEPPRQKRPKLRHPADVRTLQEVYRAGWVAQFKPKDGKPPAPLPGDATLLDGLLEAHGLVECQRLVNAFLSDPDAFLAKQGHRLRLLPAKVDAYRATRAPPRSPAIGYAQPSEFKGEGGDRTHVFRRRNA